MTNILFEYSLWILVTILICLDISNYFDMSEY